MICTSFKGQCNMVFQTLELSNTNFLHNVALSFEDLNTGRMSKFKSRTFMLVYHYTQALTPWCILKALSLLDSRRNSLTFVRSRFEICQPYSHDRVKYAIFRIIFFNEEGFTSFSMILPMYTI